MNKMTTPWYKKWWGMIIALLFFPFFIIYLMWVKTNWSIFIKTGITVVFIALILVGNSISNQNMVAYNDKATEYILINDIESALMEIEKSKKENSSKDSNPAFILEKKLNKLISDDLLKETLVNMSDEDFALLQTGELSNTYIDHEEINKLYIVKLKNNSDIRERYLAELEQIKKDEEANKRKETIELQFSLWDGSHKELTKLIKDSMNDPKSYEHVETMYWDKGDYLIINTTFRVKNTFGGVVKTHVKAIVGIEGEILEIVEPYAL